MASTVRRKFDIEFKRRIVNEILSGEKTIGEVCREHSLAFAVVSAWKAKELNQELIDKPSFREKQLEKEVKKLLEKVGELTIANDLLKKLNTLSRWKKRSDGCVYTGTILKQKREF
jgi:transposase